MDRKIEKKKWTVKNIILYSGALIIGLLIIFQLFISDKSSKLNVNQNRIVISKVYEGEFQEFIPVIGTVIPIKTNYLDAIEGGTVKTIFLEAGSFVNQGDPILELENANLLMEIMYREAELFQQSNNLRNTRLAMEQNRLAIKAELLNLDFNIKNAFRDYNNKQKLAEDDLIAIQEFEAAEDEYDYLLKKRVLTVQSYEKDSLFREIQLKQIEDGLERMNSNLEIVKENMNRLVLRAPVTGQLTSLNAEIGESKSKGERLGQVDVLDGFKLLIPIDEYYLSRVSLGQRGTFTFNGEKHELVVSKVYPEVINGRFKIEMQFVSKEPEGIRRGQSQHIRLELGDPSTGTLLARGGFFQKTGGQWVYLVDKSGKFAVKQSIKLGRQNSEVFEVLEGLKPGDEVITSSYESFGDIEKLMLSE